MFGQSFFVAFCCRKTIAAIADSRIFGFSRLFVAMAKDLENGDPVKATQPDDLTSVLLLSGAGWKTGRNIFF